MGHRVVGRGRVLAAATCFLTIIGTLTIPAPAHAKYASLVIDANSGAVLEALNADARTYPASLTKMMTLYLTFDALRSGRLEKNQRIGVSYHASIQPPSKLDLTPGTTLTVEQAILALTVKSANDVAVVLAEAIGGTEARFAQLMTQKARQLGMRQTVFRNASGLPNPSQVTSARDMATLARALVRDYPQYYHYFSAREFTFQGTTIPTHNHVLVNYDGADGLKTGYIHASGFNLVTSAVRNGRRLIGVVLGGQTSSQRDHQMMRLLDIGFAKENQIRQAGDAHPLPKLSSVAAQPSTQPNSQPTTEVEADEAPVEPSAVLTPAIAASSDDSAGGEMREANWGIQVGAYGRIGLAQQAAAKAQHLTKLLSDAVVSIGHAKVGGTKIYRARLVGLSEDQARMACVYIHHHKGQCLLVPPSSERSVAQVAQ